MNIGLRTCRRISGLPQAALLVPLLLLAPAAHAQAEPQPGAQPVPDQPAPDLDPMPAIGDDWPQKGPPDIVTPRVELPPPPRSEMRPLGKGGCQPGRPRWGTE